jgi:ABC-type glutathione transport system ATPase component
MNRKLLEVVDLTIRYKNAPRNAVSNFSININDSECVGIVGESGSGKTTIALSIAGLLTNNADIKVDKLYFQSKNLKVIKRKELLQIRKRSALLCNFTNCYTICPKCNFLRFNSS